MEKARAGTEDIARFLAAEISADTYLNIMAQYHPCYHASDYPDISQPITGEELSTAIELARRYGLRRLDERVFRPFWLIPW